MGHLIRSLLSIFILFYIGYFVFAQKSQPSVNKNSDGIFTSLNTRFTGVAFDSSHSFDVLHYRLDLTFPLDSQTFSGVATITCRSNLDNLDEIFFDMAELKANLVLLWGQGITATQNENKIFISLGTPIARNDTFSVSIYYHSETPNSCFFYYEKSSYTDWPIGWFPCFNVPWDKATAELHITVPT